MSAEQIFNFIVDKETLTVTVERSFEAPLDLVWAAWTEAELLNQWWAPRPYRAVTKVMDFREGGRWQYAMTSPKGQKHWDLKVFLTIDPKTRFVHRSQFCDENGDVNPAGTSSLWDNTFVEKDSVTVVTNAIKCQTLEHLERQIEMGFKEGYTMGLDQLAELLAERVARLRNKQA